MASVETSGPAPGSEDPRLLESSGFGIAGTEPGKTLDHLVALASRVFAAPTALVSFIDHDARRFDAHVGFDLFAMIDLSSFLVRAVTGQGVLVVADATHDQRFKSNPLVVGEPHIRFFAIVPLLGPEGRILGTLSIVDNRPRAIFSEADRETLKMMAGLAAQQFELLTALESRRVIRSRRLSSGAVMRTNPVRDLLYSEVEERRRPEPLFDTLFDHNPIPMWIFDAASLDFVAANDAACALYGYTREEILQRNALDVRLEEDHSAVLGSIRGFGEVFQSERSGVHVKANGERIRILTFARRLNYGGRNCVVVWNIDVTEREQAAVELRSTQIFFDAIVESIPSMIFVKDAYDGRFVLLNKAGEALLGLDRHDLIGKTDFDLFDPEDAQRFRDADQAVVASGKLVTIENEPLSTPEGLRSLRTQKIGVADATGRPRYLLGISEDVTEKLRTEERSRHLALHDVLTDLPNRLQFQNILERQLENADSAADFALVLLDLDRFKAVNDSLGHHAGDELLRQVSGRMLALKGERDIIARLGGDEFGLLHCSGASEESASKLARTLISALCEPFSIEGHIVSIGCSAGIALKSRHGANADALMKRADLALYAAKATGKGDYAWFEFTMEEKADRERILRDELSIALEKRQFHIEYQPIVSTDTGRVVCCEALLRWRHPIRGLISPVDFIPVAEASGLIETIGRWVLEQACAEASSWPRDIRVAVNLSPRQFTGFGLAAEVTRALQQAGLAPDRLELEITESVFLTDSQENVRILNQLKHLGVHIALDDFGTGYSSLAYLRSFSFDKLKIDRSFIRELTLSPENLAIVRAVIGLGKSFAATVTAEGVENEQQYACLAAEGCDQAQGYLLARPMIAEKIRELLTSFCYSAAV